MRVKRFASSHEISKSFVADLAPFVTFVFLEAIWNIYLKDRETDNGKWLESEFSSLSVEGDEGIEGSKDGLEDELIVNGVIIVVVLFKSWSQFAFIDVISIVFREVASKCR